MVQYFHMPRKPKHNYDIDEISELRNKGLSFRSIDKLKGLHPGTTRRWVKNNYTPTFGFIEKDDKNKRKYKYKK